MKKTSKNDSFTPRTLIEGIVDNALTQGSEIPSRKRKALDRTPSQDGSKLLSQTLPPRRSLSNTAGKKRQSSLAGITRISPKTAIEEFVTSANTVMPALRRITRRSGLGIHTSTNTDNSLTKKETPRTQIEKLSDQAPEEASVRMGQRQKRRRISSVHSPVVHADQTINVPMENISYNEASNITEESRRIMDMKKRAERMKSLRNASQSNPSPQRDATGSVMKRIRTSSLTSLDPNHTIDINMSPARSDVSDLSEDERQMRSTSRKSMGLKKQVLREQFLQSVKSARELSPSISDHSRRKSPRLLSGVQVHQYDRHSSLSETSRVSFSQSSSRKTTGSPLRTSEQTTLAKSFSQSVSSFKGTAAKSFTEDIPRTPTRTTRGRSLHEDVHRTPTRTSPNKSLDRTPTRTSPRRSFHENVSTIPTRTIPGRSFREDTLRTPTRTSPHKTSNRTPTRTSPHKTSNRTPTETTPGKTLHEDPHRTPTRSTSQKSFYEDLHRTSETTTAKFLGRPSHGDQVTASDNLSVGKSSLRAPNAKEILSNRNDSPVRLHRDLSVGSKHLQESIRETSNYANTYREGDSDFAPSTEGDGGPATPDEEENENNDKEESYSSSHLNSPRSSRLRQMEEDPSIRENSALYVKSPAHPKSKQLTPGVQNMKSAETSLKSPRPVNRNQNANMRGNENTNRTITKTTPAKSVSYGVTTPKTISSATPKERQSKLQFSTIPRQTSALQDLSSHGGVNSPYSKTALADISAIPSSQEATPNTTELDTTELFQIKTPHLAARKSNEPSPLYTSTPAPVRPLNQSRPLPPLQNRPPARKLDPPRPKLLPRRLETIPKSEFLPNAWIKQTFSHFSKLRINRDAVPEIIKTSDEIFAWMCKELKQISRGAGRADIKKSDCETLLQRNGFINKKISLNGLIEKYLPLELRQDLIPIARSGNKVVP